MKRVCYVFLLAGFILACGNNDNDEKDKTVSKADITQNPDYKKGLALIANSDCLTCHKIDEASTGPSYRQVANKYAGGADTAVSYLGGKIINGGKGVWGDAYMTPHADLSVEEAESMARYILLLKN
jgi:cytochrome c